MLTYAEKFFTEPDSRCPHGKILLILTHRWKVPMADPKDSAWWQQWHQLDVSPYVRHVILLYRERLLCHENKRLTYKE